MNKHGTTLFACMLALVLAATAGMAQQAPPAPPATPYGTPIGIEAMPA